MCDEGCGPIMENGFVRTATCERCLSGIKAEMANLKQGQSDIMDRIDKKQQETNRRIMVWIAGVSVVIALLSNLDKISAIFHIASK